MRVYFFNADNYKTFTEAFVDGAVYATPSTIDAADPIMAEDSTIPMGDLLECIDTLTECLMGDLNAVTAGVVLPETKKFISLHDLYTDLADHSYEQIVAKQKQGA